MIGRLFNKKNVDNISKNELYGILDELPVPIIFLEKDRTIRFANKEALKLGAYDELHGKKCTETFCKGAKCECPINGNSLSQESAQKFIAQNGQVRPVIKKAKSVNCNGDSFYVQFITDLSEQQEKENKLKEIIADKVIAEKKAKNESTKFEELFEGISEAIIVNDFKGDIIKINQNACQQLGYSREELLSMNIRDVVPSEIRNKVEEELNNMLKCNHAIFESVLVTKEGTKIPVEVCINVMEFDEKEVVLGTIRDITIRKKFQEELVEAKKIAENNETELKTIFNKVPSSIIIFDEYNRVLRINEKGRRKFNVGDKNVKELSIGEVINCNHLKTGKQKCGLNMNCPNCQFKNLMEKTIQSGNIISKKELTLVIRESEQEEIKTMLLSTAILKSSGNTAYIATLDDITERKRMEVELIDAKEKAEQSEKLKTAFLHNISHEIRTPLNGLIGFLDFFEDDITKFSEEERKHFIKIMRKSGDRLINTVTDIVEVSKLNSGIFDFKSNSFSLKKAIVNLFNATIQEYENSDLVFSYQIDEILEDCQLHTDESKLLNILKNLISNAFKFTTEGRISLEIKYLKYEIYFSVSDTGIGISEEDISIIFNPFRQVDINSTRAFEGNGLGLTIASKLVKFLGGELKVISEKGIGSSFFFSLPKSVIENDFDFQGDLPDAINDNLLSRLIGKTILIAEDDEVNYQFLKAVLSSKGCKLIYAENGKEAVDQFLKNPGIDLIIMDLKMPVMNGIEAAMEIKTINDTIPIIAHLAYVLNNEREKSLAAGCIDYLPKPVKSEDLLKTIGRYIAGTKVSN